MKELLFEDPFWLYGFLAMAEAVLVWLWWKGRERAQALRALIPLGLAAVVFAVSTLVVTDREKIQQATREIVGHVKAGRAEGVAPFLDTEFRGTFQRQGLDRKQALAKLEEVLRRTKIGEVAIKRSDVEVRGTEAFQKLSTLIEFRGGWGEGRMPVHWQLRWVKTDGRWRIFEVSEPVIALNP